VDDHPVVREGLALRISRQPDLEVFRLIGEGLDTTRIAAQMCLSPKTVETYRARIKEKLHLTSSRELLRQAVQWLGQSD
jgi:DNA-binding NarL/FixJ family response regulator